VAAAGLHPRRPVTPASGDYRYRQEISLAVVTGTQHYQDRRRPKAHPANGWWPRCWPSLPSAASSSPQRPAWPSVTGWDCGVPWAALGRAWIAPSPSRSSPPSRSSSSNASITAPVPKREPRFPLRWRACNRSSAGALGSFGGGRTVTDPSAPRGRPPSRRRPPIGSRTSGRPSWAGCYARGFNGAAGD
jgi:hypothetical protein